MTALLSQFQENLKHVNWQNRKIIVAVSGGLDSMVLATLFYQSKVTIELAHCNFCLRGEESDGDERFVKIWAEKRNIPLHVKRFDTLKIVEEKRGNLENIARDLRYDWFENLRKEINFDLIAVAHHQQDNVETLLIKFFKGTGFSGLHGILPERGKIIRPLLPFSKEGLKNFAIGNQIIWREDSSNATNDYLRNRIRHELLPQIEAVFPQAVSALNSNIQRFREAETLYKESVERYRKSLLEKRNRDYYILILKLKKCPAINTILYELLKPFGFSAAQLPDALSLLNAVSGKYLRSEQYLLSRYRDFLILTPNKTPESAHILIEKPVLKEAVTFGDQACLTVEKLEKAEVETVLSTTKKQSDRELVALKDTDFPLVLRPVKEGDYFYPVGMQHKKKKVGKFLRDIKMPLHEKKQIWVLESRQRIVWVVGFRMDERFKTNENSLAVFSFFVEKNDRFPIIK